MMMMMNPICCEKCAFGFPVALETPLKLLVSTPRDLAQSSPQGPTGGPPSGTT